MNEKNIQKQDKMKLVAYHPETGEKYEAEIVGLMQSDLKFFETFHFPDTLNPEDEVKRFINNQDISADEKSRIGAQIQKLAECTMQVGKHIYSIGKKIFDSIRFVLKSYPGTAAGIVIGMVLTALIPSGGLILGWLFGPLKALIISFTALLGYSRDVFSSFNNPSLERTVKNEAQNYEPLSRNSQPIDEKPGQRFKKGLDRGIAHSVDTVREMVVYQAEAKFGKKTAEDLKELVAETDCIEKISEVGKILIKCKSSVELLQMASKALE